MEKCALNVGTSFQMVLFNFMKYTCPYRRKHPFLPHCASAEKFGGPQFSDPREKGSQVKSRAFSISFQVSPSSPHSEQREGEPLYWS